MKTILYILSIMFCLPCYLYGQDDHTRVTVHVGEQRLSDLLTIEQKCLVQYLTVTGTLTADDYAYLDNDGALIDLYELNLRDADIDTIPEGVLCRRRAINRVVLPFNIKHIEDNALNIGYNGLDIGCYHGVLEVSGRFPTRGVLNGPYFTISDDNPYYEKYTENGYEDIYSANGDTLFYMPIKCIEHRVKADTKVIHSTALRSVIFYPQMNLVLPNSLDSIGDYALDIILRVPTTAKKRQYPDGSFGSWDGGSLFCEAPIPPKLGRDVFSRDILDWNLYVPESSLDLYRNAEGWNSFANIRSIEWLLKHDPASVSSVKTSYRESSCVLTFPHSVRCLSIYNLQGMLLKAIDVNSTWVTIDKTLLSSPYALVRVQYGNGDVETLKLKP